MGVHWGHIAMYTTIILALAVGWVGHSVYIDYTGTYQKVDEIPGDRTVLERITDAISFGAGEVLSPNDHIEEDQILVYDDRVVLLVDDPTWSSFTDTNSMDPLLDAGANGVEIAPTSVDDIHIGDVISYKTQDGRIVIHRVIDISTDEFGLYYTVKGDNNPTADANKVRFEDVQGILIAVVY